MIKNWRAILGLSLATIVLSASLLISGYGYGCNSNNYQIYFETAGFALGWIGAVIATYRDKSIWVSVLLPVIELLIGFAVGYFLFMVGALHGFRCLSF